MNLVFREGEKFRSLCRALSLCGEPPEFTVEVDLTRPDGAVSGRMTIVWTLRPNS